MGFRGEEIRKLDDKNRLIVPGIYRFELNQYDRVGFYLTVSPVTQEKCVRMYSRTEWDRIEVGMRQLIKQSPDPDAMARVFATHSQFVEMDRQYRVAIPPRLMEFAGLEKKRELVIAGCGNHLQLWNVDAWKEQTAMDKQKIAVQEKDIKALLGGYGGPDF